LTLLISFKLISNNKLVARLNNIVKIFPYYIQQFVALLAYLAVLSMQHVVN